MANENLTEIGLVFSEEGYDSLIDKIKKVGQGVEQLAKEDEARVQAAAKVAKATAALSEQIDRSIASYAGSKSAMIEYKAAQIGATEALEAQIAMLRELETHAALQKEAFASRQQDLKNEKGLLADNVKDELRYIKEREAAQAQAAKMARGLEADRIRDIQFAVAAENKAREDARVNYVRSIQSSFKEYQNSKAASAKLDQEVLARLKQTSLEAEKIAERQAISEINWAKKSRDEQIRIKQEIAAYRTAGISPGTISSTFGPGAVTGTVRPVEIPIDTAKFQRDTSLMRDSLFQLRSALATLGVSFGIAGLIQLSDSYTLVTGKILNATSSQSEFNFVLRDSMRIATNAQSDVGAIAQSYSRLINNTKELNTSQKLLSLTVEAASLALKVNGASVQESTSALQQLSQAFGKGKLDGDEFRTLMEAAPGLMRQVATSLGVPFGALKDLAKQGVITGEVLLKALGDQKYVEELRLQAREMLTISGAFRVFTNNLTMFIGQSSESSGVVRSLTTGLIWLSENLGIVSGLFATVVASKFAQWLADTTVRLYAQVAARQAALAATLATARADAIATGQAAALTAARVAELRAAAAATSGNAALAVSSNTLAAAQARATAASAAHAAALGVLTVAQRAASLSSGVAAGAMALLGGPIGAIVTLLGIGAVAWMNWGNSSKKAQEQAAEASAATTGEILQNLEKQNAKLRERIALANAGNITVAAQVSPEAEKLAGILAEMNELRAKGTSATVDEKLRFIDLQANYDNLNKRLRERVTLQEQADGIGRQSKAGEWMEKLATNTEKMNAELKKAKTELGDAFTPEIEKRIRAQYATKTPTVRNIPVVKEESFVGLNKFVQDQEREFQMEAKHADRMLAHKERRFQSEKKLADEAYAVAKDNADTKSAIGLAEVSVYTDYVNRIKELNVQLAKDQLARLDKEVAIGKETTAAIIREAEAQVTKTEDGLLRKQAIIERARDKQRALEEARNDKVYEIGNRSGDNIAEAESRAYKQSIADVNKLIDATNQRLEQKEREYAAIGLSKERVRELAELEDEASAKKINNLIVEETMKMHSLELTDLELKMYKERIAKLEELYIKTMRFVEINQVLKARQLDWQAGMAEGINNYMDSIDNAFNSSKKLTEQTFKSMEDTLEKFLSTGKLNFSSFFATLGAGLARLYIQTKVLGPMMKSLDIGSGGGGGSGKGIMDGILGGVGKWFGFGGSGSSSLNTMAPVMPLLGGIAYAEGGHPPVGTPYLVGEKGPEWRMDRTASVILPNGKSPPGMGQNVNVYNTFILQQPADQRTQDQIAVKAGQSIQRALERNT